jgi:CrcB protein
MTPFALTMFADPSGTIRRVETLVLVAIGGYAGSNLRYLVGDLVAGVGGTLLVNVLGSFALGFLLYEARYSAVISRRTHVVVGTGFLSSFTTYSAFALEAVTLGFTGIGYVAASYVLGFGAVVFGQHLALVIDGGEPQ